MLAGQVDCDNDPRDGGLLADRVALERAVGLYLAKTSLFDYAVSVRPTHISGKSIFSSFAWDGAHEHGRDREGSVRPEAILAYRQDSQHV